MGKPFIIGLTGSIGMGKSTTAQMFADEGIPVWDADDAVHRLYDTGGAAVEPIRKLYPGAVADGMVDRARLREWIQNDETALGQIVELVHPLVALDRQDFIRRAKSDIVLLDIPLLFETGNEKQMDMVIVVSAPAEQQRTRVLERAGMTTEQFETILAKQLPDAEKRARADHVIDTTSLGSAQQGVQDALEKIRKAIANA